MKRILRIGMDVHSTNYTLCAIEPKFDEDDIIYANIKVTPKPDNIVQLIENIKKKVKMNAIFSAVMRQDAWAFLYTTNW